MRRNDREIERFDEITGLLDRCDTIRVGCFDGEYPYVVPLSFGWEVLDGRIALYFHGAAAGHKRALIAANPKVCVEADILHGYVDHGEATTADYESIIGFGRAEVVTGAAAVRGIELLMAHCGRPGFDGQACAAMKNTEITRITLDRVTGKRRFPRPGEAQ